MRILPICTKALYALKGVSLKFVPPLCAEIMAKGKWTFISLRNIWNKCVKHATLFYDCVIMTNLY